MPRIYGYVYAHIRLPIHHHTCMNIHTLRTLHYTTYGRMCQPWYMLNLLVSRPALLVGSLEVPDLTDSAYVCVAVLHRQCPFHSHAHTRTPLQKEAVGRWAQPGGYVQDGLWLSPCHSHCITFMGEPTIGCLSLHYVSGGQVQPSFPHPPLASPVAVAGYLCHNKQRSPVAVQACTLAFPLMAVCSFVPSFCACVSCAGPRPGPTALHTAATLPT